MLLIAGFLYSILMLITGIIGVMHCDKPEKAPLCLSLGITVTICALILGIFGLISNGITTTGVFGLAVRVAIPYAFVVAAKLNKQ